MAADEHPHADIAAEASCATDLARPDPVAGPLKRTFAISSITSPCWSAGKGATRWIEAKWLVWTVAEKSGRTRIRPPSRRRSRRPRRGRLETVQRSVTTRGMELVASTGVLGTFSGTSGHWGVGSNGRQSAQPSSLRALHQSDSPFPLGRDLELPGPQCQQTTSPLLLAKDWRPRRGRVRFSWSPTVRWCAPLRPVSAFDHFGGPDGLICM